MADSFSVLDTIISSPPYKNDSSILFQDPKTIMEIQKLISNVNECDFLTSGSSVSKDIEDMAVYGPILLLWSCFLTRLKVYVDAYDENLENRDKSDFYQSVRWLIGFQEDGGM